jgi:hypothetical protein
MNRGRQRESSLNKVCGRMARWPEIRLDLDGTVDARADVGSLVVRGVK